MKCHLCYHHNERMAKLCSNCGAALVCECPSCETICENTAAACSGCGCLFPAEPVSLEVAGQEESPDHVFPAARADAAPAPGSNEFDRRIAQLEAEVEARLGAPSGDDAGLSQYVSIDGHRTPLSARMVSELKPAMTPRWTGNALIALIAVAVGVYVSLEYREPGVVAPALEPASKISEPADVIEQPAIVSAATALATPTDPPVERPVAIPPIDKAVIETVLNFSAIADEVGASPPSSELQNASLVSPPPLLTERSSKRVRAAPQTRHRCPKTADSVCRILY